jgi:MFS family permease
MTQLVVFRGLQGLFSGILLVTVFTVLADIFVVAAAVSLLMPGAPLSSRQVEPEPETSGAADGRYAVG